MDMSGKATSENFLAQVSRLIDWARLVPLIEVIGDRLNVGVPLAAVKMLLLARWYGLSDPALLEACQDRLSFRKFLDLPPENGGPGDARLAEMYRQIVQVPFEAQNVIHAVESQLLASGFSVRPGLSAEAAVTPLSDVEQSAGEADFASAFETPEDRSQQSPAEPGLVSGVSSPADFHRLLDTAFFQPGEMAELMKQGESAFVRGGARVASNTDPPHRPAPAELVPPPEVEPQQTQVIVEWPWGFTMDLTDRLKVGRDHQFCLFASELQPYLHVSRKHAELTPCPEGVWVRDLKSRNGTFVNEDELPKGQAFLVDSDATIRFGPHCTLLIKIKRS